MFARCAFIHLAELLKNPRQLLRGNANPRVFNRDTKFGNLMLNTAIHINEHMAGFCKLHSIANKIGHNLANATHIPNVRTGKCRVDPNSKLQILLRNLRRNKRCNILNCLAQRKGCRIKFHLARINLREIQYVIDDRQQRITRLDNHIRKSALLRIKLRLLQQLSHPHHTVHRCPDLMRHVRQKLALRTISFFCLLVGTVEFIMHCA